jgi:putative endopeptidase
MKRFLIFLAASTALCAPVSSAQTDKADAPPTAERIGTFGFDSAGMDRSVKPGDNMYRYANGAWAKATPIPADKSNYGMFTHLADVSERRTRALLEEAGRTPGSKMGDFYASFMDRAAVEAAGHKPLLPLLRSIDGAKDKAELARVMGELTRKGVALPFFGFADADDKKPDVPIYQFYQAGIGLPDRDYYLSDEAGLKAKKDAYRAYLAKLFTLVGESDADARAAAVLDLETKIAQAHWNQTDTRDAEKTYNLWSRADFAARAPGLDWDSYLGAMGVASERSFIVRQPSAVTGMSAALAAAPLPVLKDYLKLQAIDGAAPLLSKPFVDANFAFRETALNGTPQIQEPWKRAVGLVTGALGHDLGKAYVARFYPPETKAAMDDLVRNVMAAMDRRIQGLSWMSAQTKSRARAKLAAFTPRVGFPERWYDYSALEVRRGDLLGNALRANEWEHKRQLAKLGKPVDRTEWGMLPMTVNAQANFNLNAITFPAAILQAPFFDASADPAINYGAIGAVIGHEISHHFDDQGSKYDETGALKEWWSPDDVKRFNALTDQLVAQFDKYEIFPGKFLNGRFTLGDNVGDLAGLQVAYDAYRASLGGKEAPVIDGLTGDQRFFLGWAQVWRRNYREENLRQRLITDPHAPSEQRVAIMRNLDAWYKAFNVTPGQTLYLPPEQRVRIW